MNSIVGIQAVCIRLWIQGFFGFRCRRWKKVAVYKGAHEKCYGYCDNSYGKDHSKRIVCVLFIFSVLVSHYTLWLKSCHGNIVHYSCWTCSWNILCVLKNIRLRAIPPHPASMAQTSESTCAKSISGAFLTTRRVVTGASGSDAKYCAHIHTTLILTNLKKSQGISHMKLMRNDVETKDIE